MYETTWAEWDFCVLMQDEYLKVIQASDPVTRKGMLFIFLFVSCCVVAQEESLTLLRITSLNSEHLNHNEVLVTVCSLLSVPAVMRKVTTTAASHPPDDGTPSATIAAYVVAPLVVIIVVVVLVIILIRR